MYSVMIIDDEKEISNGFARFFPWEQIGFTVKGQFTNAGDALAFLQQNQVDVIISDVRMPGMSGLEMAAELKRGHLCQDARLIFFSAYDEFCYAQQAISLGADQYILKSTGYQELIQIFTRLKTELDEAHDSVEDTQDDATIAAIKAYIKENLSSATLEDAAAHVFMSVSYISRYFKQQTGRNFADWVMELRMQKAAEMLKDPRNKIYVIGEQLGYHNPYNFSRAFKRFHQLTPLEYRRKTHGEQR